GDTLGSQPRCHSPSMTHLTGSSGVIETISTLCATPSPSVFPDECHSRMRTSRITPSIYADETMQTAAYGVLRCYRWLNLVECPLASCFRVLSRHGSSGRQHRRDAPRCCLCVGLMGVSGLGLSLGRRLKERTQQEGQKDRDNRYGHASHGELS